MNGNERCDFSKNFKRKEKRVKIKLGIDVDDCICNTVELDYACAYYVHKKTKNLAGDFDSTYYDVTKTFGFTKEEGEQFYKDEKQYIMKHTSMYPKVFVKEVFRALRRHGFEIVIISSRDNKFWKGNAQKYLKKWLKTYHIEYDKIYANVSNKADLCQDLNIEYLIEDNVDYIKKANTLGINTILIKQSYNKDYNSPHNIFAENWLDLYSILAKKYHFTEDIIQFTAITNTDRKK